MTTYIAPTREMQFVVTEVAGLDQVTALPGYEDATAELVESVLDEAARLATEVLAPLNKPADEQGARLENHRVLTADGFASPYKKFVDGGWNGLAGHPDYGGQGLPSLLLAATFEMWNSANMSFALCPLLSAGAAEAVNAHGSEEQKRTYLPKMISGEWTGTMKCYARSPRISAVRIERYPCSPKPSVSPQCAGASESPKAHPAAVAMRHKLEASGASSPTAARAVQALVRVAASKTATTTGDLLTPKEGDVLRLLAAGHSNKLIAKMMDISDETVKWHLKNLFSKLSAGTRRHAVDRARMMGLVVDESAVA